MELSASNLRKSYSNKLAVDNVDIKVSSGETLGLLGPNGAGKTTLFYMIVGLLSSDSGEILVNGENITKENISLRAKKGISYLPQEPSVFRRLTVRENIKAALEQRKDLTEARRNNELEKLAKEFNIYLLLDSKAIHLSGGERRRLEIARALASNPAFLLLDEPFAGIDPIAVSDLKETIRRLNSEGLGIVISDHNVRDTMQICHKVLIISNGKTIAEGSPIEVSKNKLVKEVYLGQNFSV
tara:strand:+ start:216 stop:938 length:723 start_codon:yes stop_codon:yes gene_type:complete